MRSVEHWDKSPQNLANTVVLEILKNRLVSSSLGVRRTNLALRCENGAGGLSLSVLLM